MQNQIVAFFILVTLALGLLSVTQWRQANTLRRDKEGLELRVAELTVELDGKRAAVTNLEQDQARWKKTVDEVRSQVATLQGQTNEMGGRLARVDSEEARQARWRAGVMGRAWLWSWQDEVARRWLLERQTNQLERVVLPYLEGRSYGGEVSNRVWRVLGSLAGRIRFPGGVEERLSSEMKREWSRVRELLGESAFGELSAFVRTLPERIYLAGYREGVAASPLELTPEAYEKLVRLATDVRVHGWEEPSWLTGDDPEVLLDRPMADLDELERVLTRVLLEESQAFLNEEQRAELRRYLALQPQWREEAGGVAVRLMGVNGPPEGP